MTRAAIISDIHFGSLARSSEFAPPGIQTQDNTIGDVSLTDSLVEVCNNEKPEYLFITGDLTSVGEPQEFYYFEKTILSLSKKCNIDTHKIICCLGNHDVDWSISNLVGTKDKYDSEVFEKRKAGYETVAATVGAQYLTMLRNPSFVSLGPAPLSGVYEANEFIAFCLNTGWKCCPDKRISHGELTIEQLDWFNTESDKYKSDSRKRIVLMHHHPFNYPYPTLGEDVSQIVEGAEFIEIAENNKIDLVIHGHRHHPKVKTIASAGHTPITFLCAGSLSVNASHRHNGEIPNMMHFIDIDKSKNYFMLHNYSYSGAEGWKASKYSASNPMDATMKVGQVYLDKEIRLAVQKYKDIDFELLHRDTMPIQLQFLSNNEVLEILKQEIGETHSISGDLIEGIAIFRKGKVI